MFPTFYDLAVAMNQLDIEREDAKRERMAIFLAGSSVEGFGDKLGRLVGGFRSLFGQTSEAKSQSSPGSMA